MSLIVAAELSARGSGPELLSGRAYAEAARVLDAAGLHFLTIPDSLGPNEPAEPEAAQPGVDTGAGDPPALLDASGLANWLGALTRRIGIVPTLTVTHTEPFLLGAATATLDYTARARAGWQPEVSATAADAALVGRRGTAPQAELWREAGEVVRTVRLLWDSWDDDAVIKDTATGRFVDIGRLHYIDAQLHDSTGEPYTVKGPNIVPRPPQGHPVVVLTTTPEEVSVSAARARAAAEHADVVLLRVPAAATRPDELRTASEGLRRLAADHGRAPVILLSAGLGAVAPAPVPPPAPGTPDEGPYAFAAPPDDPASAQEGPRSRAAALAELIVAAGTHIDGLHVRPEGAARSGDELIAFAAAVREELLPALRARGLGLRGALGDQEPGAAVSGEPAAAVQTSGAGRDGDTLRDRLGLPEAVSAYAS